MPASDGEAGLELATKFANGHGDIPHADIRDRMLFVQALETVRSLEQGVLTSTADANIGGIFAIGYPAWTGGPLQFINYYGPSKFVDRAYYLAERYGERFTPPELLLKHAADNTAF